jgi:hypothetical protein
VFVNHLCEAKGEQDGEADEAQESFALTESRDFLSYFVLRYCSLLAGEFAESEISEALLQEALAEYGS